MAVSSNLYANVFDQAFAATINWASDTIKLALFTGSPGALNSAVHYSDLSTEVAAGGGYTTGGVTLGTKTHTVTAANSFATTNGNFTSGNWTSTVVGALGNIVKPATPNGFLYECVVAGTTGSSAAVLNAGPTVQGATVVDGTVTWSCIGESITIFGSANATWSSSTISAAYAVIYDAQTGVGATEPLIALINFGGTVSSSSSTFQVTAPLLGWFWLTPQ